MPISVSDMRGFTLLELLIVLAITSLAMVASLSLVTSPRTGLELGNAATEARSLLREARALAISRNREVMVHVDVDARSIRLEGEAPVSLGEDGLDLEFTTARSLIRDASEAALIFFPDGSSTGGRIRLAKGEDVRLLEINWMTGRVRGVEDDR